ncbi:hypothetical protein R3P38DRAFT_3259192 [Favolaschia claudopus]|uniref:Uncharacterized protein n=1 Tax=Favolaschia claudopus TaxID=2862362 RepID=A0AAW0D338_9AGAR
MSVKQVIKAPHTDDAAPPFDTSFAAGMTVVRTHYSSRVSPFETTSTSNKYEDDIKVAIRGRARFLFAPTQPPPTSDAPHPPSNMRMHLFSTPADTTSNVPTEHTSLARTTLHPPHLPSIPRRHRPAGIIQATSTSRTASPHHHPAHCADDAAPPAFDTSLIPLKTPPHPISPAARIIRATPVPRHHRGQRGHLPPSPHSAQTTGRRTTPLPHPHPHLYAAPPHNGAHPAFDASSPSRWALHTARTLRVSHAPRHPPPSHPTAWGIPSDPPTIYHPPPHLSSPHTLPPGPPARLPTVTEEKKRRKHPHTESAPSSNLKYSGQDVRHVFRGPFQKKAVSGFVEGRAEEGKKRRRVE